jgi:ERCC4-related helicase
MACLSHRLFEVYDDFSSKIYNVENMGQTGRDLKDKILKISFEDEEGIYRYGLVRVNVRKNAKELFVFKKNFNKVSAEHFLRQWIIANET